MFSAEEMFEAIAGSLTDLAFEPGYDILSYHTTVDGLDVQKERKPE